MEAYICKFTLQDPFCNIFSLESSIDFFLISSPTPPGTLMGDPFTYVKSVAILTSSRDLSALTFQEVAPVDLSSCDIRLPSSSCKQSSSEKYVEFFKIGKIAKKFFTAKQNTM